MMGLPKLILGISGLVIILKSSCNCFLRQQVLALFLPVNSPFQKTGIQFFHAKTICHVYKILQLDETPIYKRQKSKRWF